jgi:hypothetical protein
VFHLVPDHCLQQYENKAGQVENFGYPNGWIAGQVYDACVKNGGGTKITVAYFSSVISIIADLLPLLYVFYFPVDNL